MFDLTSNQSFKECEEWLSVVRNYCEENVTVILLGNKRDIIDENPGKLKVARIQLDEFCMKNKI